MLKRMSLLLIIFVCGYLLIEWLSITHPFRLSEFLMELVIDPLKFFAASIVFFMGVLISGLLIRETIHKTIRTRRNHFKWGNRLISEYLGLVIVFFLLFMLGWEHTLVFFSLSMLYGMISIDLKVRKRGK